MMTDDMKSNKKETRFPGWAAWDDNWAVGIALVLVGGLFLLDTFNILNLVTGNWWAIFILIPGLNMALRGWRDFGETGTKTSRRSGIFGMILILIAFTFFFGISWSYVFPAILIGVGVYILVLKQ
jgi:uncharacterized membrane protein YhaH (DUF805 family)